MILPYSPVAPTCCARRLSVVIAAASAFWILSGSNLSAQTPQPVSDTFFEMKIRPMLAEHCYKCHSAKATKIKGGLRVDNREGLLKGGESGPAITPDKPEDSRFLKAVHHANEDLAMPPKEKLPAEVIANFEKWIKAGAPFPAVSAEMAEADARAWWDAVADKDLLPASRSIEEVVDHYINARLAKAGVKPAPVASNANFIRRVTLDLGGRIPTAGEVHDYTEQTDPDRVMRLVDRLIGAPGFGRHQVTEFDWLLSEGQSSGLRDYLTRAFADDRRWDQIFKELLAADPTKPDTKGSEAFLRSRAKDADKLVTDVSVRFFGVNISCAQCHDHPLVPSWKQDHYYGMKSFFSRTFDHGEFVGESDYGTVSFKTVAGETKQANLMFLTGDLATEPAPVEPTEAQKKEEKRLLDDSKKNKQPAPQPKFSRRAQLAEIGLRPGKEGFFARALVNRIWHRLFGHGLVMPIDQMHGRNPPSHPELMQWLARDLVAHQYDVARLVRGLTQSAAYARSSQWSDGQQPDPALFAVALPRALTPQQAGAALQFAVTGPTAFKRDGKPEEQEKFIEQVERSGQSWAGSLQRPGDDFQVGVDEALLFSNSERVHNELLSTGGDRLLKSLLEIKDTRELVTTAVWNILSRAPAPRELDLLAGYIGQRADRQAEAVKQMVWALLTSTEFRFNH
jgi:hypothetical protein